MGRHGSSSKRKHHESSSSSSSDSSSSESSTSSSSESSSEEEVKRQKHKKVKKEKEKSSKKKMKKKHKKYKGSKETIDKSDYYNKSKEFQAWLLGKKGIYFDELPGDKAKSLFKTFVKKWNSGQLAKKYYQEQGLSLVDAASRTRYKWKFAERLDEVEMGSVRDEVDSWTTGKKSGSSSAQAGPRVEQSMSNKSPRVVKGPTMPPGYTNSQIDKEELREREQMKWKKDRKEYKKHKEMVLDEILPKATGRQAMVEKRIIRSEKQRNREQSPEIEDKVLMGGSDSFQRRLAARKKALEQKRVQKTKKATDKLQEYQKKEQEKMNALIELAKTRNANL